MKNIKLTEAHKEAMEVLANLNQSLFILKNGPFTAELYDSINGSDGALEGLLGKSVVVDTLSNAEKTKLRLEIIDRLTKQEYQTLEALRNLVAEREADLTNVLNKAAAVKDDQALWELRFNHRVSDNAFGKAATTEKLADPCFPCAAIDKVTEALDAASEFLNKVAPLMVRIYDEEQQTQENPPEPDENNGQGTGHQVYIPFHTEETEDAITEVINACATNVSLSQSASKLARQEYTLVDLGYHKKEDALTAMSKMKTSKENFLAAVSNIRASLPNETHTLESFGHNSDSFYKAVESLIGFVNRADMVREGMDSSIAALTFRGNK
jgi:hypothetical protein